MIAIIIPYRDEHKEQNRSGQLEMFITFIREYLRDYDFHIYIIEQSVDGRLFNRGALLNAGYVIALNNQKYDNFIFHDVDLLPGDELRPFYTTPPKRGIVYHIAGVWKRYSGSTFFGGVVAFRGADFETTNGFPNTYWGWGGEDDKLRERAKNCQFKIVRPPNGTMVDLENLDITLKLKYLKERGLKNKTKREQRILYRYVDDGISTLSFTILKIEKTSCILRAIILIN